MGAPDNSIFDTLRQNIVSYYKRTFKCPLSNCFLVISKYLMLLKQREFCKSYALRAFLQISKLRQFPVRQTG